MLDAVANPAAPILPKEFFTLQSMLTLTGATGATFVVCNGLQRAFDFNPRWLALAVAQLVALVGTYLSREGGALPGDYFVAVINGFLVYATAAGTTHILGGGGGPAAVARGLANPGVPPGSGHRRFLSPWF